MNDTNLLYVRVILILILFYAYLASDRFMEDWHDLEQLNSTPLEENDEKSDF